MSLHVGNIDIHRATTVRAERINDGGICVVVAGANDGGETRVNVWPDHDGGGLIMLASGTIANQDRGPEDI